MPKFVLKDMEGLYIEEMNAAINLLKVDSLFLLVKECPAARSYWSNVKKKHEDFYWPKLPHHRKVSGISFLN
jgi:hypothetical protein